MKTLMSAVFGLVLFTAVAACAQRSSKVPAAPKKLSQAELSKFSVATFAAGCFWHEEALFESIRGVQEAVSGYAGGTTSNPTYESLESGETGHAESVTVYYDPKVVSYADLLKVYFAGQDPTSVNGQGGDRGTQYRSIAFYRNEAEKKQIEDYIRQLNASGKYRAKIAVQVAPLQKFWMAEDYHQDYIAHNPGQGYVNSVCIPEIKDFQKEYPQLVKPDHLYR